MNDQGGRNYRICNQYSIACIFNTALLHLTAGTTDPFEGTGAYSSGGGLLEVSRHMHSESVGRDINYSIEHSTNSFGGAWGDIGDLQLHNAFGVSHWWILVRFCVYPPAVGSKTTLALYSRPSNCQPTVRFFFICSDDQGWTDNDEATVRGIRYAFGKYTCTFGKCTYILYVPHATRGGILRGRR